MGDDIEIEAAPSTRAAQYLRMSTDHQRYSIESQSDVIGAYAVRHGVEIVRTYADAGKSGLVLTGRKGLQSLLRDVLGGAPEFDLILVYDCSRWGRYQDADEAAYYEFLCRRAGVAIHYCAEPFDNDGSPMAALVKSIKRTMAGEFSRELSVKVSLGQSKATALGYWCGGPAPYGYRRCLVDPSGRHKQILEAGERKGLADDRVVLVLGPPSEILAIQLMFRLHVKDRVGCIEIARRLNARAMPTLGGGPWTDAIVRGMLRNEVYVGTGVYGRTSKKLKTRTIDNPREIWIRKEDAFPAIVSRDLFERAALRFSNPIPMASRAEMLEKLRGLLRQKGRLSIDSIAAEPGMPTTHGIKARFGSFRSLYEALGYAGPVEPKLVELRLFALALRNRVGMELVGRLKQAGYAVERPPRSSCLVIQGLVRVTISVCRAQEGESIADRSWLVRLKARVPSEVVIVICVYGHPAQIAGFYLMPRALMPRYSMHLPSIGSAWSTECRYRELSDVFDALQSSYLALAGYVAP